MPNTSAIWADIQAIRDQNPLILNITNNVVTNTTANALLALGASPAMTHSPDDAGELAGLAKGLVLNMGTPAPSYGESMLQAGAEANAAGVPIALDPVACGATAYRRTLVGAILEHLDVAVIRGNASEIMFLAGQEALSKGVDSAHAASEAADSGGLLARRQGCVVCVSGAVDIITNGSKVVRLGGGHPMMTKVTGLGCTATALIGAFLAVNRDNFAATAHAMAVMKVAGEMAAENAPGPGTLQVRFYDALYGLREQDLTARLKIVR